MAQATDACGHSGGRRNALVREVAASGQLVGIGTVGRVGDRFYLLHHFGDQGLVVRRHHGDFAGGCVSSGGIGGFSFVSVSRRRCAARSRGWKQGSGEFTIVGQDAVEVAPGIEAMIHASGLRDGKMFGAAFRALGYEILSRTLAVGKV